MTTTPDLARQCAEQVIPLVVNYRPLVIDQATAQIQSALDAACADLREMLRLSGESHLETARQSREYYERAEKAEAEVERLKQRIEVLENTLGAL
jgi:phage host-nuclease inhibitor protein Gam